MDNIPGDPWIDNVQAAFPDQQLASKIVSVALNSAILPELFDEISRYVLSLRAPPAGENVQANSKKRKLEDDGEHIIRPSDVQTTVQSSSTIDPSKLVNTFACKDVSVQVPARKKMRVHLGLTSGDVTKGQLRLVDASTAETQYSLASADVDEVFCLPVPDKQARQANFVFFPKTDSSAEQIVFVMNEAPVSTSVLTDSAPAENDNYVTATQSALEGYLTPHGKRVITPTAEEFASSIPQSHRKGELAYHVKAHRAAKEGYLFFTEKGIVFGFKKPLSYFPFPSIVEISYTSVLQRTFNLTITSFESDPAQTKEVEFSMLDQADFPGIDAYVKRHGLQDASMAAQRRAKVHNVNKEKEVEVNGNAAGGEGGVGEDGMTELQRAEQQLQDEEDEEEEDYEASGGESEGEGEDSAEDDEYGDDDGDEDVEEVQGEYDDEDGDE